MLKNNNRVVINVESNKKPINPMIYSNFIEHLGECIHNGLWSYDPINVSLVDDNPLLKNGVRRDLIQAVKELKPTVLRAFGGCYSDVYHWKDAIGPRDIRKKIKNEFWGEEEIREKIKKNLWDVDESDLVEGLGPTIDNQFGTDEFLTLCEIIGAEPYLNVNYGSGTPKEAAEWVEYCNGSINTKYGALRAKYGRTDPYNVKIWGIANEIYGFWEVGYEKYPEDYAKKYLEFAKKMREKDPSIKLVACGWENSEWNQAVLKGIGEDWIDYLSIHRYFPYLTAITKRKLHPDDKVCYHALMASMPLIEDYINNTWEDIISSLGRDSQVKIAFDEWGVWYMIKDIVKANYNLQDGIWTALVLMTFQKMSDKCSMANWAQMVNTIGMIQTDPDGLILTPVYLAFRLFKDHMYNNIIEEVKVDCETFDNQNYGRIPKIKNLPYIHCNANMNNEGNQFSIMLVNKHFTDNLKINLEIKGFTPNKKGKIIELTSDSPFDYNTIENRNKIQIIEKDIENIEPNMTINLAAHSITILKISEN